MERKRYKVMAYILSSGIWDTFGSVSLETVLGSADSDLEKSLREWQSSYDDQFKHCPYSFNWDRFNELGEKLTRRIRDKLPSHAEIYYEPSDDREFFSLEDCCDQPLGDASTGFGRKNDLLERKRELFYAHIACNF